MVYFNQEEEFKSVNPPSEENDTQEDADNESKEDTDNESNEE